VNKDSAANAKQINNPNSSLMQPELQHNNLLKTILAQ